MHRTAAFQVHDLMLRLSLGKHSKRCALHTFVFLSSEFIYIVHITTTFKASNLHGKRGKDHMSNDFAKDSVTKMLEEVCDVQQKTCVFQQFKTQQQNGTPSPM